MRIVIDTSYARRAPLSGIGIYQRRIVEALAAEPEVEARALANVRRADPAGGGLGSLRNLLTDTWWSSVTLPVAAARRGAELIHHALPAFAPIAGVPQVVTVHDLAFERLPELFDPRYRAYARRAHRLAALRAEAVICVSRTTAADVCELWGVPADRVVIAPLGPGQALPDPAPASAPAHFLYVGDAEPRKNLAVLLEAHRRYRLSVSRPLPLVLVGRAHRSGDGVLVCTAPGAAALAELYAAAAALVHPSLYEGFGMTALEAMRLGTPVLAAQSPGVEEVCGQAALYAPANDPDAFAEAMGRLAADGPLREDLARHGRSRARGFSWDRCATQHLAAYSLALGQ